MSAKPAVFLDRDGTLLTERGYLSDPRRVRFYPSVFTGLKRLMKTGYKLVVITNQSGVGRGYFSVKQLDAVHKRFKNILGAKGIKLAGIYFCPHVPAAHCPCRKPKVALVRKAVREHKLDLKKSFVIGDQVRDMMLAGRCGARGILVLTGAGRQSQKDVGKRVKVTGNLLSAANWILKYS